MAKAQEAPKAAAKGKAKKKSSSTMLWGLLGLVILTAGVLSALYYMNKDRIESDSRLKVIKDFVARVDKTIESGKSTLQTTLDKGKGAVGTPTGGMQLPRGTDSGRTYVVKPGENLWAIARESGLVENPWQWRTILRQNRDKIEWVFINDEEQDWKIMIAEGQMLTVDPNGQPEVQATKERKYAFQLTSMAEGAARRAEFIVRVLMRDGYYAYVYRAQEKGKVLYRVRSGFYDSEAKAKAVGAEIRERYAKEGYFPAEPWVIQPNEAERRGEGMVFGAQLVHPWVVELRDRETHADATKDLRAVSNQGDFAYIWQARHPDSGRFVYRVRVGFFATEDGAKAMAAQHQGDLWAGAHPVKVDKFEETLPGQPMLLGNLRR